jgi:hypothetical protein
VVLVGGVPLVAQALADEPVAETTVVRSAVDARASVPLVISPTTTVPDPPAPVVPAPEVEPVVVDAALLESAALALLLPGPSADEWAALRECESGGDYTITNPSGKYRGAYQFDRSTWNSVAQRHAPALIDVDPAGASPADQDAMAYALFTERGSRPWPHCGRRLG